MLNVWALAGWLVVVQPAEILVSAAVSLTEVLTEIGRDYERAHGVRVVFNFGPSNALATQIVEGAPVDLFISADERQMDVVDRAQLVLRDSRVNLLSNRLAIIVPGDSKISITSALDLAQSAIRRVALGDPTVVPAGVYAREYLQRVGVWQAIEARVVPTRSVRATLSAVDSGSVDAGIVYRTDVPTARAGSVRLALEIAGPDAPRVVYAAAVVRTTASQSAARAFLEYLHGPAATAIFERHGFTRSK